MTRAIIVIYSIISSDENVVAGDFSWKEDVSVYVIKTVDLLLLRMFF